MNRLGQLGSRFRNLSSERVDENPYNNLLEGGRIGLPPISNLIPDRPIIIKSGWIRFNVHIGKWQEP